MMFMPLAALALSASAAASPFTHLVHKHPHLRDTRVSITLRNLSPMFRDVQIDGHVYTIQANDALLVKGPAGTAIYAAGPIGELRRGQVVTQLDAAHNQAVVELK